MRRLWQAQATASAVPAAGWTAIRLASHARPPRRPPPPPPGAKARLPPPPPLGARGPATLTNTTAATPTTTSLPWRSPHEVLSAFVGYVPTFYVPVPTVAAILPEDTRLHFVGRGRFLNYLRRYPFFFDLRVLDGGARVDVRLRGDVSHPQKGIADDKFMMVDVGDIANYVARPEFIVSTDSIDQASQSVNVVPPSAPPAVRVQLEERVPVLERLRALIPAEFTPMDALEDEMPEDILFHPYFDCQGGLPSIAGKFPQHFQVVEGRVRLRPPHLAPLALNDYALESSPLPSVAALVKQQVCEGDIPHWVGLTSLYEQLSKEQKQEIKKGFKSFAGFLRAHGRAVAVSQDMLQVSMWVAPTQPPPSPQEGRGEAGAAGVAPTAPSTHPSGPVRFTYTQTQVMNELFDRFPPNATLSLTEALALLPRDMAAFSLPKRVLGWLAAHPQYFAVEDPTETDPAKARIRRASERQPLDLALAVYTAFPEDEASATEADASSERPVVSVSDAGEADGAALLTALAPTQRAVISAMGWQTLGNVLPQWLAVRAEGSRVLVRRLQTTSQLEEAIHSEESKRG